MQQRNNPVERIMADPAASDWLKNALEDALDRDPVDAANDAEVLARVLVQRVTAILAKAASASPPTRFSIPEDDVLP